MKKICLLFMLTSLLLSISLQAQEIKEPEESLSFFLIPYFSYKSHIYYKDDQKYSENYSVFGIEGSYVFSDFLMVSAGLEAGSLSSLYAKGSDVYFDFSTPTDEKSITAEKSFVALNAKLEFYFFTNPENMFYMGPMAKYLSFSELAQKKSFDGLPAVTIAAESAIYYGFCLGDRFLLYPGVIFNLEVGFFSKGFLPAKEKPPVTNAGTGEFSNYFLELRIGVGTYF